MSKQLKIQLGIFVLIVVLFSYFYYSVSKEDNIDKKNLSLSNLDTKEVNENFSNKISDININPLIRLAINMKFHLHLVKVKLKTRKF